MKPSIILLSILTLFFILLIYTCTDDTGDNLLPNQTPQPTPVDPQEAIIGSWDCDLFKFETDIENDYILYQFNEDDSYEINRYEEVEGYSEYTVETGNYTFTDDFIMLTSQYSGISEDSFADAQSNLSEIPSPIAVGYYYYADTYIFRLVNVYQRLNGGNAIQGEWEAQQLTTYSQYYFRMQIFDSEVQFTDTHKSLEDGTMYEDAAYTANYSTDGNGNITLEIVTGEGTYPFTYPYRLVNNYNTLVLNPCTRVE